MKIVWLRNNLMISSLAGSDHPGKYLYEVPHEYLSGWGRLSGKIISIKHNHWDFFSNSNFHSRSPIQDSFIFGEAASSHYFWVTTSTQQLLSRSNYFFTIATFFNQLLSQNSHFFAVIFFESRSFSQTKLSKEQPLLENIVS